MIIQFLTTVGIALAKECTRTNPLEVYILQDASSSFVNDFPIIRTMLPQFTRELQKSFGDLRVGLGIFADKGTGASDRCFQQKTALTRDLSVFESSISDLKSALSGSYVNPENSFEAFAYVSGSAAGFSPVDAEHADTVRIVVIVTDDIAHTGSETSSVPNPNLSTQIDCGESSPGKTTYAPASQIKSIVEAANTYPMVLVKKDKIAWWTDAVTKTLGYKADETVIAEYTNAAALSDALVRTVDELACKIEEILPTTTTTTTEETTTTTEETTTTTEETTTTTEETTTTTEETTTTTEKTTTTTEQSTVAETLESGLGIVGPPPGEEPATSTESTTKAEKETTKAEEEKETPVAAIAIGSAVGGVALLGGAVYSFMQASTQTAQIGDFDFEGQGNQDVELVNREQINPTLSADYGA